MTRTTVYFGPPGTGKTTTLLGRVKRALAAGVSPERLVVVAFTRRAALELRARATEELGLDESELSHWRTLHSTAARQLGQPLMDTGHWEAFGAELGLRFGELDETGEALTFQRERGTYLRHLDGLARATRRSLRDTWYERGEGRVRFPELERFSAALAAYKEANDLLDYPDLLERAPGHLAADVGVLDEAQDLTPAQWEYARRALANCREVCVAGDDDQALYDWAGADPTPLLEHEGEREVLARSYRLPRAVHALAQRLVDRVRVRVPKDWSPRADEGLVVDAPAPDQVPVGEGEWLLLARTRALLERWQEVCHATGVTYTLFGRPSVRISEARAIRAWETARRGGRVRGEDLEPALALAQRPLKLDPEATYDRLTLGADPAPWHEALIAVPPARRRYYQACLRRDARALADRPRVTLSTVHGAKGAEAERVGLLADVTPRVAASLERRPDPEHRVWYVAVTRAREELHVVRPLGDLHYRLPL